MSESHSPSLPRPLKPTPQANTSKKKAMTAKRGGGFVVRFEIDFVWFDSFEFEVGGGLVSTLRFGSKVVTRR
nr:hypothetical protein CFP56_59372 [Quercus suber]